MKNLSAKDFVNRFYTDEKFMIKVLAESGYARKIVDFNGFTQDMDRILTDYACKNGFIMTIDEHKSAVRDYYEEIGMWNGIETIHRVHRISKAILRQSK